MSPSYICHVKNDKRHWLYICVDLSMWAMARVLRPRNHIPRVTHHGCVTVHHPETAAQGRLAYENMARHQSDIMAAFYSNWNVTNLDSIKPRPSFCYDLGNTMNYLYIINSVTHRCHHLLIRISTLCHRHKAALTLFRLEAISDLQCS